MAFSMTSNNPDHRPSRDPACDLGTPKLWGAEDHYLHHRPSVLLSDYRLHYKTTHCRCIPLPVVDVGPPASTRISLFLIYAY